MRTRDDRPSRGGSFNSGPRTESNYGNPGYRGGRGGNFNRGGYNSNPQYNNNNRNYSGGVGGYNNNNMGFQGNMGVGNNYGGFNRGGMMGAPMRGNMGNMRGGRGGMNNMMAMGGPMNMGMGMGMGMGNMGMNPMMAGMGMTGRSPRSSSSLKTGNLEIDRLPQDFKGINSTPECSIRARARILAMGAGIGINTGPNDSVKNDTEVFSGEAGHQRQAAQAPQAARIRSFDIATCIRRGHLLRIPACTLCQPWQLKAVADTHLRMCRTLTFDIRLYKGRSRKGV